MGYPTGTRLAYRVCFSLSAGFSFRPSAKVTYSPAPQTQQRHLTPRPPSLRGNGEHGALVPLRGNQCHTAIAGSRSRMKGCHWSRPAGPVRRQERQRTSPDPPAPFPAREWGARHGFMSVGSGNPAACPTRKVGRLRRERRTSTPPQAEDLRLQRKRQRHGFMSVGSGRPAACAVGGGANGGAFRY